MADTTDFAALREPSADAIASVLLVDDHSANLLALRAVLDELGLNLVEARSGEEAQAGDFAVILLDVLMPGMSGFDAARRIRQIDRSRRTPIIFLTAGDFELSQIEEGYAMGAVDFLVKPLSSIILKAKVRGFVDLHQEKQRTKRETERSLHEELARRNAEQLAEANRAEREQLRVTLDQLRRSEQRFARFMQHLPGLAWIKDVQGRYIYANDAALKAFGVAAEKLYGLPDEEIFPAETATSFKHNDQLAIASSTGIQVVEELKHGDGSIRYSLVSKFPILDADEQVIFVGGMAIDITEQREVENKLRDADRRKDEFLATLAHELRNPLAPIRNALQILKMPRVDAAMAQQTREMMERQVHHLVRLVDDLLDVSRVMRGKIELRKESVELASIVARAVEMAHSLIEVQGHRLEISLPNDSLLLEADPVRMAQVVGNLLTNSAKYSEPGGRIEVTAKRDSDEIVLVVKDDGIGISPELLPHVFQLFVQADHSSTKSHGGLGIGLTLVKSLVEMHGGSVVARSDGLSKGSEFEIRVPCTAPDVSAATDAPSADPKSERADAGLRLLVVDDNRDAALSLAMLLRLRGHQVAVAHDGNAALKLVAESRPDIVFLDLGMPGMDGYEVARRVRAMPGYEEIVLAALTGWGQQEDRRRTAEAGFDHHLVKPLETKVLDHLLAAMKQRQAT